MVTVPEWDRERNDNTIVFHWGRPGNIFTISSSDPAFTEKLLFPPVHHQVAGKHHSVVEAPAGRDVGDTCAGERLDKGEHESPNCPSWALPKPDPQ